MAKLVLWNSVAKRRRSISDTFYDNGLATLQVYLEDKGHEVEIIDLAQDAFFAGLSRSILCGLIRRIYRRMPGFKNKSAKKAWGFVSILLQDELSAAQARRMKRKLIALALELKRKNAWVFGIKIWYGEAFSNARFLASELKKISPETIVIAGGYHVTLYEERLIKNSDFDLGVVCEGEFALAKILSIVDAHKGSWNKEHVLDDIVNLALQGKIENLLYRKDTQILRTARKEIKVYSSKSIPRYQITPYKTGIHVLVESLGCDWNKCYFCVHSQFYAHYSLRDPDEIVREIEEMRKFGISVFRFAGSDTPPAFGAKLASKIKGKGLKIIFGMGSRALRGAKNNFEGLVEAYSALIESGLRAVFMGGETGNDLINQKVMNKGVCFEDIVHTIKALREAEKRVGEKVFLSLAFIYPTPLLGLASLAQVKADNIRLLKETLPDSAMITPPGPFLHTMWYDEQDNFGFKVSEKDITDAMEYEYVLYKPPHLWPKLGISLEGKPFEKLLEECNEFRQIVEHDLRIPTDLSDEHFLMFYCAGIKEKGDIEKAKQETMLDIVSCDYRATVEISRKVNEFSRKLSGS